MPHETRIVSAHRTPDRLAEYAKTARGRGLRVIIAGAGGAAHLPGMCAAWTRCPCSACRSKPHALKGMDSLLSIVQMPAGIPVGTLGHRPRGRRQCGPARAAILAVTDPASPTGWMPGAPGRPRRWPMQPEPEPAADEPSAAAAAPIGIVGGGQLGRMSAMAAARLGYRCHILTHEAGQPGRPGRRRRHPRRLRGPGGAAPLRRRSRCRHLRIRECQRRGSRPAGGAASPVRPSPAILRISQDRIAEKSFLNGAGHRHRALGGRSTDLRAAAARRRASACRRS